MTNFDTPTAPGPRARLMYDAVVAAYLNDISERRRGPASVAKRRRGGRGRLPGHVLTGAPAPA